MPKTKTTVEEEIEEEEVDKPETTVPKIQIATMEQFILARIDALEDKLDKLLEFAKEE